MIPSYITGSTASTFAGRTLRKRLPAILKSVIKKNKYNKVIKQDLRLLLGDLPYAQIKRFAYANSQEEKYWEVMFEEFYDTPWIDLPFYLAEALFYRQILSCTRWHENFKDPFAVHKSESLAAQEKNICKLLENTLHLLEKPFDKEGFTFLLRQNLWGNQADLSLFHDGKIPVSSMDQEDYLLQDDTKACANYIAKGVEQVDFLIDNVGADLVGDISLALYLLKNDKAERINFHVKAEPIFVSDALEKDIDIQLQNIEEEHSNYAEIASLFKNYVEEGKINISANLYWNSPLFYDWLPSHLRETLDKSSLVISKGDAHYRRFLQDKKWGYGEPLDKVIDFFDKPLWLLRTLKSEVLAGVEEENILKANKMDSEWLVNGKFGVIQFHNFQ